MVVCEATMSQDGKDIPEMELETLTKAPSAAPPEYDGPAADFPPPTPAAAVDVDTKVSSVAIAAGVDAPSTASAAVKKADDDATDAPEKSFVSKLMFWKKDDDEDKKDKEEKAPAVSFFALFRYATWPDYILYFFGIIFALGRE